MRGGSFESPADALRSVIVCSPSYIEKHGQPCSIDELSDHNLLHYSNLSTGNFWKLRTKTGEERHVRVGGRLTANNGESLMRAAESGLGIALIPSFILGDAVTSGRLNLSQ